ncbi:MAG: ABC transporter ATP-binding protein [Burkholderiales bacterium]
MSQTPLLEVQGLCAGYGQAQVLFDLDLEVRPGEAVALLGRNGAGKSTTFKAIMGLVRRTAGNIRFAGTAIEQWPAHRIARAGLGWVPEDRRIFTDLTVLENLELARQPERAGTPCWSLESLFELFPNLAGMRHRSAAHMSGGEQQMLTVARTLMGNPRLVLLDEPSEGVAPLIVQAMSAAIGAMKSRGLAVLLSEQNLSFAQGVCDRVIVLEKGQVRHEGAMSTLREDAALRRELLGLQGSGERTIDR